jgi:hypothetical protein
VSTEFAWITGCIAAATAFCWYAPEYGYSPVPFFSGVFYVATAVVRALVTMARRNGRR